MTIKPPFPILQTALILLLTSSLVLKAEAQVTLAWTQTFATTNATTTVASVAVDANSNVYTLNQVTGTSGETTIQLRALNEAASPLFTTVVLSTSLKAKAYSVVASTPIQGVQYLLTSCQYADAEGHLHVLYSAYSTQGALLWKFIVSGTNGDATPLGMDTDETYDSYLATAVSTPTPHLQLNEVGVDGTSFPEKTNFRIAPDTTNAHAYLWNGYWLIGGKDNLHPNTVMWGAFEDQSAVLFGFKTFTTGTVVNGFARTYTNAFAYPFNNQVLGISNYNTGILYFHQCDCLSDSFAPVWTHFDTGTVNSVATNVSNSLGPSVYFAGSNANIPGSLPFLGQIYKIQGSTVTEGETGFSTNFTGGQILANSTDEFLYGWNHTSTANQAQITEFAPNTQQLWTGEPAIQQVTAATLQGDNFVLGGTGKVGTLNAGAIARYVTGFAMSTVTATPATITGGGSTQITIKFNQAAPADAVMLVHTTCPGLIFSKSSSGTLIQDISAGQSSVTVLAETTGFLPWTAEVTATCNGVLRATTVTLN